MKSAKKIITGIILLATAVLIILSYLNVNLGIVATIPVTDLLLCAILLSIAICAVIKRNVWFMPYPLAIMFMLLEKEIAIWMGRGEGDTNLISNWLVFLCAVIASVGLGLIFSEFGGRHIYKFKRHDDKEHIIGTKKHTKTVFGSEVKYIDCTNFSKFYYRVNMGDGEVFFENPENYKGDGLLVLECRMGNMEVTVPSAWNVKTDIHTTLGNTEIGIGGTPDGPLLRIEGENHMGNIEIHFC